LEMTLGEERKTHDQNEATLFRKKLRR